MNTNIFEELSQKKQSLISLTQKAKDYGWITPQKEEEIINRIKNDVLTIGVIGQMKSGKSTFLNAFVFEDDVLPAATTPMTAALSIITYGEKKEIEAEFYTPQEWEEQKMQASRSLEDVKGNEIEESKVKAAKELMEKAHKLGSSLESFLGKNQKDTFENLEEYVGADGKYISITKAVKIYYPKEYLKGVEIVDTPGFNDPIVSREERTKEFLEKADAVLLMLYAGRPFDSTDRSILFENVGKCGIGKVIIGINKYDIAYENGDTIEEINEYVKQQIKDAAKNYGNETLSDLLKETSPIPLSAEMALLSQMPMSKINESESYSFSFKRHCDNFEINSQNQLRDKSFLNNLTSEVKRIIDKEKTQILFTKPINELLSSTYNKENSTQNDIIVTEEKIKNLSLDDDEIDEKLKNVERIEKRLNKKLNIFIDGLDEIFREIVKKGSKDLDDMVDNRCNRMDDIIEKKTGIFKGTEKAKREIQKEIQQLTQRDIKHKIEHLSDEVERKVKNEISDFIFEVEGLFIKYIPDFESQDLINSTKQKITLDIDGNAFTPNNEENLLDKLIKFVKNIFRNDKNELYELVNKTRSEFKAEQYLEKIYQHKENIAKTIKTNFFDEVLTPMRENLEQLQKKVLDKENALNEENKKLEELTQLNKSIKNQIKEFKVLKSTL